MRHIMIYKSENTGQWYFRFVADNGEPIGASSEGYHARQEMMDTISKYFPDWEVRRDKNE